MISEGILTCRRCGSRYPSRIDFMGDPSICDECKKEDKVERLREREREKRDSSKGFKIIPVNQPFKETEESKREKKVDLHKKYTPSWARLPKRKRKK